MIAAPCADYVSLIPGAAMGVLEHEDHLRVVDHLAGCDACQTFSDEIEVGLAAAAPSSKPAPRGGYERLEAQLSATPARPAFRIQLSCTYCHGGLGRQGARYCASCLAPHHADCFAEHGRCAGPGCDETRSVAAQGRPVAAPTPTHAPTKRTPRLGWIVLLVGGLGAAALALQVGGDGDSAQSAATEHDGRSPAEWLRVASILNTRNQSNTEWNDVLGAFVEFGALGESVLSASIREDTDERRRETAIRLASELRAAGCVASLLSALSARNEQIWEGAAKALPEVLRSLPADDPQFALARTTLAELVTDVEGTSESLRMLAVRALRSLEGRPDRESTFVLALNDPAKLVRREAVHALANEPPRSPASVGQLIAFLAQDPEAFSDSVPSSLAVALWHAPALNSQHVEQLGAILRQLGAASDERLTYFLHPLRTLGQLHTTTLRLAISQQLRGALQAAQRGSHKQVLVSFLGSPGLDASCATAELLTFVEELNTSRPKWSDSNMQSTLATLAATGSTRVARAIASTPVFWRAERLNAGPVQALVRMGDTGAAGAREVLGELLAQESLDPRFEGSIPVTAKGLEAALGCLAALDRLSYQDSNNDLVNSLWLYAGLSSLEFRPEFQGAAPDCLASVTASAKRMTQRAVATGGVITVRSFVRLAEHMRTKLPQAAHACLALPAGSRLDTRGLLDALVSEDEPAKELAALLLTQDPTRNEPGVGQALADYEQVKRAQLAAAALLDQVTGKAEAAPRGWFGASMTQNADGALVFDHVLPNGPAANAGIEPGTRLLVIGGKSLGDMSELFTFMETTTPGQEVKLTVQAERALATKSVTVRLTARPDPRGTPKPEPEASEPAEAPGYFGAYLIQSDAGPLRVGDVLSGSPAEAAGVQRGMLLLEVNGRTVRYLDDFYQHLNTSRPGQEITLTVRPEFMTESRSIRVVLGERPR